MPRLLLSLGLLCLVAIGRPTPAAAQDDTPFARFNRARQQRFDDFNEKRRQRFEAFRRQRNEAFARYIRKGWRPVEPQPVVPRPDDDRVPPVVVPHDEVKPPAPQPRPVPIKEVVPTPDTVPQPQPVEPILEVPIDTVRPQPVSYRAFTFYGTSARVRYDNGQAFRLKRLDENAIADAWLRLSEADYTNLVYDCLQLRTTHRLCDWAYLQMLEQMADAVCGKGTNEAVLLMAYVYCQSGYKMRLAIGDSHLYMLFASAHLIFHWGYYTDQGERWYAYNKKEGSVRMCSQQYPKERPMSLLIREAPALAYAPVAGTAHHSTRYTPLDVRVDACRNMLAFYSAYPTSTVGDNFVVRWAMYANMPMPEHIRRALYPTLRRHIAGLDQLAAANRLLQWVQTGFVYEYDDKVWGHDRAFFPEESLYYPACDCEDRAILYTRLMRDLLGLDCLLVYYPGHLAAAVAFTEGTPTGDYLLLDGRRYFVTDGTILGYGASVGTTMTGMDNAGAKVIRLDATR